MPQRRRALPRPPLKTAFVVPRPSDGALALARSFGNASKVVKRDRIEVVHPRYNCIVNWGSSSLTGAGHLPVINAPSAVALCVDKRKFFEEVGDLTNLAVAYNRAEAEALFSRYRKVVCRTKVASSGGEGIVIARSRDELVNASLYTAYIPKRAEYRVHIVKGGVILIQQKRRSASADLPEGSDADLIRNHANGWIYAVDNVDAPSEELKQVCLDVASALGLDFAAVDVMVGASNGKPYVLEVNTAPGIRSHTLLNAYTAALTALVTERINNG